MNFQGYGVNRFKESGNADLIVNDTDIIIRIIKEFKEFQKIILLLLEEVLFLGHQLIQWYQYNIFNINIIISPLNQLKKLLKKYFLNSILEVYFKFL